MLCLMCDHNRYIEGPDAMVFFHKIDNKGLCESCLLVCIREYTANRLSQLDTKHAEETKDGPG